MARLTASIPGTLHGDAGMSAWFEDDTLWESLEGFLFSQFRSFESAVRQSRADSGARPSPTKCSSTRSLLRAWP